MKIEIRTDDCLYIELGEYTYYIDNSTGENILERWLTNSDGDFGDAQDTITSKNKLKL